MDIKFILGRPKYDIKKIDYLDSRYNDEPYYLTLLAPHLGNDGKIISYKEIDNDNVVKMYRNTGEGYIIIIQHIFRLMYIPFFDLGRLLSIHDLLKREDLEMLLIHIGNVVNRSINKEIRAENKEKGKELRESINSFLLLHEQESKTQPPQKDETTTLWFKVGLMFAKGEISLNITDHLNTTYPKLSKKLGNTSYRGYIEATIKNYNKSNTDKNLFYKITKPQQIIDYCRDNNIKVCKTFLDKFNKIELP